MTATWKAVELSASARRKLAAGTRLMTTAWLAGIMKARAVPYRTMMANTGQTPPGGRRVKVSSNRLQSNSTRKQKPMMRRRS